MDPPGIRLEISPVIFSLILSIFPVVLRDSSRFFYDYLGISQSIFSETLSAILSWIFLKIPPEISSRIFSGVHPGIFSEILILAIFAGRESFNYSFLHFSLSFFKNSSRIVSDISPEFL